MTFEQFKIYHSETIMYCQCIEHDLKWIYSYMHKGDQYENFEKLEKTTLGTLVKKLKELDNSDGKPFTFIFRPGHNVGNQCFPQSPVLVFRINDHIAQVIGCCEITDHPGKSDQLFLPGKPDTVAH